MEISSPLCQTYTSTVIKDINLKVDRHAGDEWFSHGPKHRKEKHVKQEQV